MITETKKYTEIDRIFRLDVDNNLYHYRDGSYPPFAAELLESEAIKFLDRANDRLMTALKNLC